MTMTVTMAKWWIKQVEENYPNHEHLPLAKKQLQEKIAKKEISGNPFKQ